MEHIETLEGRRLYAAVAVSHVILRAGALDPRVGAGGFSATLATVSGVHQSDGRTLSFGYPSPESTLGELLGTNANGSADTAFDRMAAASLGSDFYPSGLAVQVDDKIIVSGAFGPIDAANDETPAVLRLNPDGSLDPSFGTGGIATLPKGLANASATLEADGDVILLSYDSPSGFGLARLTPNGTLDPSYGTGGVVSSVDLGENNLEVTGSAVQPDGKVLLFALFSLAPSPREGVVLRVNTNGSADATFGTAGKVTLQQPEGWVNWTGDLALQSDGKMDLYYGSRSSGFVERLDSDGIVDQAFGKHGRANVALLSGGRETRGSMFLDPQGHIFVGAVQELGYPYLGHAGAPPQAAVDFTGIVRLTESGRRDPSFGNQGVRILFHQLVYFVTTGSSGFGFDSGTGDIVVPGNRQNTAGDFFVLDVPLTLPTTNAKGTKMENVPEPLLNPVQLVSKFEK